MNLIEKIILFFKKPKAIVLTENNREEIKKIALKIIGSSFRIESNFLFANDIEKVDLSKKEVLIYNFDRGDLRKIKEKAPNIKILSFGFQEGADFQATDLRQGKASKFPSSFFSVPRKNEGMNFKINYRGNIVPIWLPRSLPKEEIYFVLAAALMAVLFGLNLVEISQALKE